MGRGFIELYDDNGFRYFVNIDKIVNVSVDNKRVWRFNALPALGDADGLVYEMAHDGRCVQ